MNRKMELLIILGVLLVLLSGCWNRRELDELAIVMGLAIDKEDDQYVVTTQVVNPGQIASQQTGQTKTPVTVFEKKAESIFEAIRKITTTSPRKLYFAHLRLVVLEENLAKEGIGEILDFLSRDQEFRTDFYVIVAKDTKASSVFKVLTTLEEIPATQLFESLQASEDTWAPTVTMPVDKLITEITNKGIQPNLTGISIIGEQRIGEKKENIEQIEPAAIFQYSGISALKGDKLIGWFSEEESKGIHYALGEVKSTVISVPCSEDKNIEVELIRTESDITAQLENDTQKGTIDFQAEGNIAVVGCKEVDLTTEETIRDIESKANKVIKDSIEAAVKKSQEEFEADYFGFGKAMHRSNPKYWKDVKNHWDKLFADMSIEIKVDVNIKQIGTVGNSPFLN